jgi:hypothetical protein
MNKFMYDGQEIEIPKISPIGNDKYKIEEGSYSGEIFWMKNFILSGDMISFDCESNTDIQEIVLNYVRYLLVRSLEEF